jgi:hypothetical protein
MRSLFATALALVATVALASCGSPSPAPQRERVTVARPAGSWQGSGATTIGFVSDTGRFRIRWQTSRESAPGAGTFRLTVHSAVSGRPLEVVADHRGEGSGEWDFADDPRPYNFMVESANVDWSFSVDAITVVDADAPSTTR